MQKKREKKLNPYFIPNTKINSQWTKDLNVRHKTINMGKKFYNIGSDFLDMIQKHRQQKK